MKRPRDLTRAKLSSRLVAGGLLSTMAGVQAREADRHGHPQLLSGWAELPNLSSTSGGPSLAPLPTAALHAPHQLEKLRPWRGPLLLPWFGRPLRAQGIGRGAPTGSEARLGGPRVGAQRVAAHCLFRSASSGKGAPSNPLLGTTAFSHTGPVVCSWAPTRSRVRGRGLDCERSGVAASQITLKCSGTVGGRVVQVPRGKGEPPEGGCST